MASSQPKRREWRVVASATRQARGLWCLSSIHCLCELRGWRLLDSVHMGAVSLVVSKMERSRVFAETTGAKWSA